MPTHNTYINRHNKIVAGILPVLIQMAILSITSCSKNIEFKYDDIPPKLVVEGRLSDEGASVRLTQTTPMAEPMDTTLLTNADVTLTDLTMLRSSGEAEAVTTLIPEDKGVYRSDKPGIPGHRYRLDVMHDGALHSSESTMLPRVAVKDLSVNWIKMPYDYVALIQVSVSDAERFGDYYWVRLYRNGNFYKWAVTDDSASSGGVLMITFMTTRENLDKEDEADIIRPGDIVTAVVTPIERSMYYYLTAISNDSSGPLLFTGNDCLGYFIAASPTTLSLSFPAR